MTSIPSGGRLSYSTIAMFYAVFVLLCMLPLGAIAAVNKPPVATSASVSTKEDTKSVTILLKGVDPEKKKLTYAIVRKPSHGTLTLEGNKATYVPAKDYFSPAGQPDSFTFNVNDGELDSAPATVSIMVTAVNDAPVALAGTASVVKNIARDITLSGTDVEGDALTYIPAKTSKKGGTLKLKSDNLVTYTPKKDFVGEDSFTFTVTDSKKAKSVAATVTLTVNSPPSDPKNCPLADPILNGKKVNGLSCQDRLDVNYYQKRILPYLMISQTESQDQASLVAETFNADTAAKAIDTNPILIGLQGIDSALDGVSNAKKGQVINGSLQFSIALSKSATALANGYFILKGSTGTEQADAVNDMFEVTNSIIETLANTAACINVIFNKKANDENACFDATSKTMETLKAMYPNTLKSLGDLDRQTFKTELSRLSHVASFASSIWKSAKSDSEEETKRALFGVANSLVKFLRDSALIAYTSKGEEIPTTGWEAWSLQTLDYATIPVLTLGEKCWGGPSGKDPVADGIGAMQCASTIVQESGKTAIRGVVAGIGAIQGIRTVKKHSELLIAQAVIEETLAVGRNNMANLYKKYGVSYNNSNSISTYLSRRSLAKAIGEKLSNGTLYSASAVWSTVDAYLNQIYNNAYLDVNSESITLTASNDPLLGGVILNAKVTPNIKGFSTGRLVCYSDNTSNYLFSNPVQRDFSGATNLSFKFNFMTGGDKTILCALYRKDGLFDSAKSVIIRHPPHFTFTPSNPSVGTEVKFVGGAAGIVTNYSWDFGDGTTDSSSVFLKTRTSHTYMKVGTYTVKFTVVDGLRTVVVKKNITIGEARDDDKDGMPDWWEAKYGVTDPKADDDVNGGDGLNNLEEYNLKTDPKNRDTDGDGFTDKQEVDAGTDPLDKTKYPVLAALQLTATPGDAQVTLKWNVITGATGYAYCRSTIKDSPDCATYSASNPLWKDVSGTEVTVKDGLQNGNTYFFRIVAKGANGRTGAVSEERPVTLQVVQSITPSLKIRFDQASLDALGANSYGMRELISGRNGGTAVKFYGINNPGHIRIPNRPEMKFTDAATFDMWVRADSKTGMDGWGRISDNSIMSLLAKSHDRTGMTILLTPSPNPNSWFATYDRTWSDASCKVVKSDSNVPLNTWFRITMVASSTKGTETYINKELTHTCPNSRPSFAWSNGQDLYIGKFSDYWYPFNGAMQDVNIYQQALTKEQVQALP